MQPIILALDTATDACSVALSRAKDVFSALVIEPQAHSKLVLHMINDVCQQAGVAVKDVDAIAFGRGPGSFTGVRIAASVVQGLALGLQKPVIGISSLQALAQQAANTRKDQNILALIDARMHEVYWGIFSVGVDGLVTPTMADSLQKPELLQLDPNVSYLTVGTGAVTYAKTLQNKNPQLQFANTILYPRAMEVLQLAIQKYQSGDMLEAYAMPTYVRNDVAQKDKKNPD